ncbi:restriction endonuclease FokI C-terminal domain-containing protein [Anaerosporobacter faecicola]|uniref:restriction endonuclease FokI C-terminal domain-containing protein n=1 Tax=Anaerosporobacter faecicola TaxID=2718714 RepID=UPI001439E5CB|nr:restriction endonuclease FokI C-terminal domain-containing protein [Anaerosporobacter faecicola]
MITIWPVETTNFRAFGWVQDPSNLRSLCNVTAIFDENSPMHKKLVQTILPQLVEERDGRDDLIQALQARPLRIPYSKLVGTAFKPRKDSRCNGIVQATVKGQIRPFIGEWQADNFVRWAYAFHFIQYNYEDDTFTITEEGRELVEAWEGNDALSPKEISILTKAILAYPPAVRILTLLAKEDAHLTKFELGKQLGFIGENGFTSLPQSVLLRSLAITEDPTECSKMKADWEGSSDKYARMIAKWLSKLGLVEMVSKTFDVSIQGKINQVTIGQAYQITTKGYMALNHIQGKSSYKKLGKNICFEMLATKAGDREYLRSRRAYLLKFLSEAKSTITLEELVNKINASGISCEGSSIEDDINGLINIGLQITKEQSGYCLQDCLSDFIIPTARLEGRSELEYKKEEVRHQLTHLSHEYLGLLDLAYDSKQNRLFELKTMQLLTEECDFEGLHLGGSRKPDGIAYSESYGIIIDTKAYSGGYSLPISQADEMERYIGENQTRDPKVNPNEWWKNFSDTTQEFYFMFVAGHFKGKYQDQIERISCNKSVKGAAVSIEQLLLTVNAYKAGKLDHEGIKKALFESV